MKHGRKIENWLYKNATDFGEYAHGSCCHDGDSGPKEFFEMGIEFGREVRKKDKVFWVCASGGPGYDGDMYYFFAGPSQEAIIAGWKKS
jgi:hypothetical protein